MSARLVGYEGPLKARTLYLDQGTEWIIGRDPDECQIVLEDSKVSRKHLVCRLQGEDYVIANLSDTNPIYINDTPLEGLYTLKEGDVIKIGTSKFTFTLKSESEKQPSSGKNEDIESQYDSIFDEDEEENISEDIQEAPHEAFPENKLPEEGEEEKKEESHIRQQPGAEESSRSSSEDEIDTTYDTIFSDSDDFLDELGEFALGPEEESRWYLKVLAGPNIGAEFGMTKGKVYVIGKDVNSCDILFHDLSVSRNHAKIHITEDETIEIQDLGSRNGVLVDGEPIQDHATLTTNSLVTLGTTTFVVIDREKSSETIIAESPKPTVEETPPPVEEPAPPPPVEEEEEEEEEEVAAKAPKESIAIAGYTMTSGTFMVTGALIAVILVIGIGMAMLFSTKEVKPKHIEYAGSIKDIMKEFPGVQYTFNDQNGNLFLYGHVLTSVDKEQLLYAVEPLKFVKSVEDNIVVDELIWREMNQIIGRYPQWRGVAVHADEPGNFVVTGYLNTRQQMALLNDYLQTHFPYTDRIANHVIIEENLYQDMITQLRARGYNSVTIGLANGDVTLTGYIGQDQQEGYLHLVKEFRAIPGVNRLNDYVITVKEKDFVSAIDLSDEYQVTGYAQYDNVNMSVVISGQILTVGSKFNEMIVTSIQQNVVYLEKNGLNYKINYTN